MIQYLAGLRRFLATGLGAVAIHAGALGAQAAAPVYRTGWGDAAALAAAAALAVGALHVTPPAAACAPCDPASLPGIDRWVVDFDSHGARVASDVAVIAVVGGGALATLTGVPAERARGNAVVLANAGLWTVAASEWLKRAFHRERPALYRTGAAQAASDADNRLSFPSGHTAIAFAAATSYAMMAARQHLPHAQRNTILLYTGATTVGALRVAGGKHFPTDVLAGAALGAGIGWLTARLHPTNP